jgi:hypothetical protein
MMRCLLVLLALSLPSCVGDDSGPSAVTDAGGDSDVSAPAECVPTGLACGVCYAYATDSARSCWAPCPGELDLIASRPTQYLCVVGRDLYPCYGEPYAGVTPLAEHRSCDQSAVPPLD